MNKTIQAVIGSMNADIEALTALDHEISGQPLILAELQTWPWETLWGVGRSHPVDNPKIHGAATFAPGHPAVIDYRPVVIPSDRDNLYTLMRLGGRMTLGQVQSATKVKYSLSAGISNPAACQAFEFECQRQVGTRLENMAWQMKPQGGVWVLSAFNYATSEWKESGMVVASEFFSGGRMVSIIAEFSISDTQTRHEAITINGNRMVVAFTQPTSTAKSTDTYFNAAVQLDANAAAMAYKVSLESVSVEIQ